MNPFFNPLFLGKALKTYVTDIGRIERLNEDQLAAYQGKMLRRIVKYAYNVPVYHKKYKKAGIHPSDIKSINDIEKLPFITKQDIRKNFPDGIVPPNFNQQQGFCLSTSGSTGKPVTIYRDAYAVIHDLWGFIREIRHYGISWPTDRLALLSDLAPGAAGNAYLSFSSNEEQKAPLFSFKNIQTFDISENVETLMNKLNVFKPDLIHGYPDVLQEFAALKRKGKGEHINPRVIVSNGAVLSDYTREYIQKAFDTPVFDTFSSTEAGPALFECRTGNYHVHSDFAYLEFVDKDLKPVSTGESGQMVVTRFHGKGTPIIRYTGNDDIMTPLETKCSCGISSRIIKNIGGRSIDILVLPDGRTISPFSITGIPYSVMKDLKTDKIQQFQIIQQQIDTIDVLIVIDDELRDIGPSVTQLKDELQHQFEKQLGEKMHIQIKEVDEVYKEGEIVREVISKVEHN